MGLDTKPKNLAYALDQIRRTIKSHGGDLIRKECKKFEFKPSNAQFEEVLHAVANRVPAMIKFGSGSYFSEVVEEEVGSRIGAWLDEEKSANEAEAYKKVAPTA